MTTLIQVENVSKTFKVRQGSRTLLAGGGLRSRFGRREKVCALDDLSFTIEDGSSVGIIGRNGSGKSTLLKIMAGVTVPTTGRVTVRGRLVSLLELGAGFHPLLTGRENVFLNGHILGMTRQQMQRAFDDIVEFSGIGDSIDNPVNTYSSGMFVRLGFAVAVHTNPDIFLVDEVLSVGDEQFQRQCRSRIHELKEQGKTIVFVSHDLNIVNALCDDVILLKDGKIVSRGTPRAVIDLYLRQLGREIASGSTTATFYQGGIVLAHGGQPLTQSVHLHTQARVDTMWAMSHAMQWDDAIVEDGVLRVTGSSQRFPYREHWELRPAGDDAFAFNVWFEALEPLDVQEYNVSLGLRPEYTRWRTPHEAGAFPPFDPKDAEWRHLNRSYDPAGTVGASADSLPSVELEATEDSGPFRMTLINTGYEQRTRVLQAIRISEHGQGLHYEQGRHLWFSGVVRVKEHG